MQFSSGCSLLRDFSQQAMAVPTRNRSCRLRTRIKVKMTLHLAVAGIMLLISASADERNAVETSHPTASSTRIKVVEPECNAGEQTLQLAKFCSVATSLADSLPRISFKVNPVAPSQVVLLAVIVSHLLFMVCCVHVMPLQNACLVAESGSFALK